ncbi:hypothetical protein D1Z97_00230 [Riemerella anatipestifer]|uniref:hypothetical protein n=1 Tax=Riemerella anatipestifer TaxID=34085 RepID=UPI00129DF0B1|nr:hypothetical protein [Riemerella anatipestifer]MBT0550625.1 hypothetical protein [Riemerella anatipestifer]MBT0553265.1 hypothetical protein [Riemerella anatipestifer]MCE3023262.1 hypothetical protein [Riemerella anatipestifer]MCU7559402.1 hypothetical protein [Riemerella anatipestifer]MCW0512928.1 hypothetical protein [Riemerella anatipestifer]
MLSLFQNDKVYVCPFVLKQKDEKFKSKGWVCLRHGTAPCYLEAIAPNTATGALPKLTFARQTVDNS